MFPISTFKWLGPYLQHFVLFITYKWAQQVRVLQKTKLEWLLMDEHTSLLGPCRSYEENEVL
jgi:hypothetical protein